MIKSLVCLLAVVIYNASYRQNVPQMRGAFVINICKFVCTTICVNSQQQTCSCVKMQMCIHSSRSLHGYICTESNRESIHLNKCSVFPLQRYVAHITQWCHTWCYWLSHISGSGGDTHKLKVACELSVRCLTMGSVTCANLERRWRKVIKRGQYRTDNGIKG